MKKKRIILHMCILMLAATCIASGVYMFKNREKLVSNEEYGREYRSYYSRFTNRAIEYVYAQYVFRKDFSDLDRVIAESSYEGKFTVRDLIKEYSEEIETHKYFKKMRKNRKQLSADDSKANKEKYNYYKTICEEMDKYELCLMALGEGESWYIVPNKKEVEQFLSKTIKQTNFFCSIKYKISNKEYVMENAPKKGLTGGLLYTDVSKVENGELIPLKAEVIKRIKYRVTPTHFTDKEVREFVDNNISEMTFGVNKKFSYDDPLKQNYEKYKKGLSAIESEKLRDKYLMIIALDVVMLIIAIALFVILLIGAGHKKKNDIPRLNSSDRIWLDAQILLLGIVYCIAIYVCLQMFGELYNRNMEVATNLSIALFGAVLLSAVEVTILTGESFIRRIKCRALFKTTLIGKIFYCIKKMIVKLMENAKLSFKVICLGIILAIWTLFTMPLIEYNRNLIEFLIIFAPAVIIPYIVWKYFNENQKIEEGAQRIAEGDVNYKIEDDMKFRANRSMRDSINNIGDGLNAALSEGMKNERMKTELITNVSHDLKTPLTSIINYIDLLKTDGLNSEKAEQYLDILDQKSQRLKNLTEDLVEVSKLNSGAAKLQMERLDLVQLVNQSLGEYMEKLAKNKLQIVKTIQEEPLYVLADGRKTWRLFENLYENAFKYAMPNTRVYVDVKNENGKAKVAIKNISKNPLNFSGDELMERFVRGDVSRTTEGSGLGLSIAKSIAQRQDGDMNIILDGDLFKVEVVMNLIK